MASLFDAIASKPLAERLRPASLGDIVGQDHLLGPGKPINLMIRSGRISSLILWGPPGVGKTSIARLLARAVGLHFESLSAVTSATSP